jgi:glutamate N-acetyltransferase/amino-acid N-acetyltransferase
MSSSVSPLAPTHVPELPAIAGVRLATGAAGIKYKGRTDVLLALFDKGTAVAGVLTRSKCPSAPVEWCRARLRSGKARALVVNSGNANAFTGKTGREAVALTAKLASAAAGCKPAEVFLASTGVIGEPLAANRFEGVMEGLAQGAAPGRFDDAARAIMTTDTVPKTAGYEADGWSIGGIAKGAAMLAPGLATMLVVLTTDAVLAPAALDDHLARACSVSFERIDSDGCMSTNDTVLLLSSGASGIAVDDDVFEAALTGVCLDLALQLLDDAEGAAHTIAITVHNAATVPDAVVVGKTIARSNLLKCAIFGRDPNWGRVLSAIGTTAAAFEPDRLDVAFNGVRVCRAGGIGEPRSLVDLTPREVRIDVDLHAGSAEATVWTNDLTYDYVKENAEYST